MTRWVIWREKVQEMEVWPVEGNQTLFHILHPIGPLMLVGHNCFLTKWEAQQVLARDLKNEILAYKHRFEELMREVEDAPEEA